MKLTKEQFFTALEDNKIKSFVINGIRFYTDSDREFIVKTDIISPNFEDITKLLVALDKTVATPSAKYEIFIPKNGKYGRPIPIDKTKDIQTQKQFREFIKKIDLNKCRFSFQEQKKNNNEFEYIFKLYNNKDTNKIRDNYPIIEISYTPERKMYDRVSIHLELGFRDYYLFSLKYQKQPNLLITKTINEFMEKQINHIKSKQKKIDKTSNALFYNMVLNILGDIKVTSNERKTIDNIMNGKPLTKDEEIIKNKYKKIFKNISQTDRTNICNRVFNFIEKFNREG